MQQSCPALPATLQQAGPSDTTFRVPAKRPLRTYSKRDQPGKDEPATKRRRGEEQMSDNQVLEQPPNQKQPTKQPTSNMMPHAGEPPKPPSQTPSKPTRTSIMHYFQPAASSSSPSTADSSHTSSEAGQNASSPPSSPPVPDRKGRGRMTISNPDKDIQCDEIVVADSNSDLGRTSEEWRKYGSDPTPRKAKGADAEAINIRLDEGTKDGPPKQISPDGEERRLKEGQAGLLNKGVSRARKARAAPKKEMTQMILDLGQKSGFVECKECCMLYNTLHDKDVKDHARQHAAIIRKGKMKGRQDT
ncbi:hypothetical protein NKR23_g5434 [Pleurostoma richardsiae]|uniref:N-acetyltransferase ESCO zinc-finger domain-containing protein n=1 Tax=Pleurostoma richardsiae TaxID=41990 RepID=A0AA38RGI2_9PEZI|nr:hypothetical protein NKR23_g5434 [Pleurostoma richardsiae]